MPVPKEPWDIISKDICDEGHNTIFGGGRLLDQTSSFCCNEATINDACHGQGLLQVCFQIPWIAMDWQQSRIEALTSRVIF